MRQTLAIISSCVESLWRRETFAVLCKYALAGGCATGVNFLVRIPLTSFFGFEIAVILAQALGFTTGFLLYRTFVFTDAKTTLTQQITAFGGVNLVAAGVVISVAIALRYLLLAAGVPEFYAEMMAHAGGLATGAPFNFSGHFLVTFRSRHLS